MTNFFLDLTQTIADGLLFGSTYALVAIGFTLIWGLLRILNLAHGETVMIGMFAGMLVTKVAGLPIVIGIPISMLAGGLVGLVIDRVCYRPLRKAHELVPMIATLGFWILVEELFTKLYFKLWFRDYVDFPNPFDGMGIDIGQIRLRGDYVVTLCVAAVLVIGLYVLIYRTRLGLALRMVAEDHDIGSLMGVPVSRVLSAAFFLSAAYGGAAGYLLGMTANLAGPYAGSQAVVKGLFAMILGGAGSIPGAIVGGLMLGVLELLSSFLVSFSYRDAIAMLVLFIVLVLRPQGLVGRSVATRV
ncbi:branched-chain amino acid ABC transporter permease [Bradyrhizobium sp. CIR3A]|uniref:branched-chain amino acid ABC transporter permease n=1 Tax=Bradyrhizobium sp. CIR3A TaxID=2663838 RepID=UPI001606D8C8|nr:branched-chain amino acid ABC transporter permease [Bradyrhizobium sp. CIR3A]MBB4261355.1 branched-chain amino acid transport system permease protein [Bradyrhizobium sp. CIR3A]